jgi:hypothetical protein
LDLIFIIIQPIAAPKKNQKIELDSTNRKTLKEEGGILLPIISPRTRIIGRLNIAVPNPHMDSQSGAQLMYSSYVTVPIISKDKKKNIMPKSRDSRFLDSNFGNFISINLFIVLIIIAIMLLKMNQKIKVHRIINHVAK